MNFDTINIDPSDLPDEINNWKYCKYVFAIYTITNVIHLKDGYIGYIMKLYSPTKAFNTVKPTNCNDETHNNSGYVTQKQFDEFKEQCVTKKQFDEFKEETNKKIDELKTILIAFIIEQRAFNKKQEEFNKKQLEFNAKQEEFNSWVKDVFKRNNLK